jgi:hypothetical protein
VKRKKDTGTLVGKNEGDLEVNTESIPPQCRIKSNIHENVTEFKYFMRHKSSCHIQREEHGLRV